MIKALSKNTLCHPLLHKICQVNLTLGQLFQLLCKCIPVHFDLIHLLRCNVQLRICFVTLSDHCNTAICIMCIETVHHFILHLMKLIHIFINGRSGSLFQRKSIDGGLDQGIYLHGLHHGRLLIINLSHLHILCLEGKIQFL